MNFLEFFAIVEQERDILNPISPEKLEKVAVYAGLRDGLSVLDVGSGKGALLQQWAQKWDITGTGLELNPAFVQAARDATQAQGLSEKLSFWEGKALDFPAKIASYDVVVCLGATFALGTFSEAVQWMRNHAKSGGVLIVGDVILTKPLPQKERAEHGWQELPTLTERYEQFRAEGLELIGLTVSSPDDWDHYTSLMWSAVNRWATQNPTHPDRAEVLQKVQEGKQKYLNWEREHLGWAIMVGRVNAPDAHAPSASLP